MHTRLRIRPVGQSSRVPASTSGMPVRPCCQRAGSASSAGAYGKLSKRGLKLASDVCGEWKSWGARTDATPARAGRARGPTVAWRGIGRTKRLFRVASRSPGQTVCRWMGVGQGFCSRHASQSCLFRTPAAFSKMIFWSGGERNSAVLCDLERRWVVDGSVMQTRNPLRLRRHGRRPGSRHCSASLSKRLSMATPGPIRCAYVSLRVVETARRGARHSLPITVSISMPTVQCASLGCRSGARGLMV